MKKATETSPTLLRFATLPVVYLFACLQALGAPAELTPGEVGEAYSFQITTDPEPPEGTEFTATNLPPGLVIGLNTGLISGNPTTAGVYDQGIVTLTYPSLESDNLEISITISASSGTPIITSAATASGTVGQEFSYSITADNDPQSYNVDGDLPNGITFSGSSISGTPTEAGTFPVTLSANNGSGTGEETTLTITIDPAGAVPVITSSATLSGDANEQISYQIIASESPTSYSASGLPLNLSLNTETGFISGDATIEGVYNVELTATNANGTSDVFTLTITIGDLSEISSSLTIETTQLAELEAYQLSASNNPTAFSVDTDALPDGLTFDPSTNKITGTATEAGTFNVAVSATNAVGDGPVSTIVITVAEKQSVELLRPASFSVDLSGNSFELFLEFDQSVDDLSSYDWKIETSTDLKTWTPLSLDDESLTVTITDNEDSSKSVVVQYPNIEPSDTTVFIRYRVEAKQ